MQIQLHIYFCLCDVFMVAVANIKSHKVFIFLSLSILFNFSILFYLLGYWTITVVIIGRWNVEELKHYSKITYSMRMYGRTDAHVHSSIWYEYRNKSDVSIHRLWLLIFFYTILLVYFWNKQFQSSFWCVLTQFDFNIFNGTQSIIIFILIWFDFILWKIGECSGPV